MITIPQLTEVQDIGDTDVVMITHSDGTSKKIAGQNILSAGTNTVMATSTSITGPALKTGMGIKVFFTVALTGSNTSTPLALTYNSVSKTVKVPKDGALADFCAFEVSTGVYKYCQAYTTLELIYDGTNFIIVGNPVVLSASTYLYYADGSHAADSVVYDNKKAVTSDAVRNALKFVLEKDVDLNNGNNTVTLDSVKSYILIASGSNYGWVFAVVTNGYSFSTNVNTIISANISITSDGFKTLKVNNTGGGLINLRIYRVEY